MRRNMVRPRKKSKESRRPFGICWLWMEFTSIAWLLNNTKVGSPKRNNKDWVRKSSSTDFKGLLWGRFPFSAFFASSSALALVSSSFYWLKLDGDLDCSTAWFHPYPANGTPGPFVKSLSYVGILRVITHRFRRMWHCFWTVLGEINLQALPWDRVILLTQCPELFSGEQCSSIVLKRILLWKRRSFRLLQLWCL